MSFYEYLTLNKQYIYLSIIIYIYIYIYIHNIIYILHIYRGGIYTIIVQGGSDIQLKVYF